MKKKLKIYKLVKKYMLLSNGSTWITKDYSAIQRFSLKEKDWKNFYIWQK